LNSPFWIKFSGGLQPGCIVTDSAEKARDIAESKYGQAVRSVDLIPYRSFPVLHSDDVSGAGSFEPRCTEPDRCKGKWSCQKRPSCSE